MQKITVKISAMGAVEYEVEGVKGKGCMKLTKAIDEITGGQVLERRKTGEFCEIEETEENVVKTGGRS